MWTVEAPWLSLDLTAFQRRWGSAAWIWLGFCILQWFPILNGRYTGQPRHSADQAAHRRGSPLRGYIRTHSFYTCERWMQQSQPEGSLRAAPPNFVSNFYSYTTWELPYFIFFLLSDLDQFLTFKKFLKWLTSTNINFFSIPSDLFKYIPLPICFNGPHH